MFQLDYHLFQLINQVWTSSWADTFFPWVTDLHKSLYFQIIACPLILLFFRFKFQKKGFVLFLICALAVGATDIIGNQIKHSVQRPRPAEVEEVHAIVRSPFGGYSFMSNHASNMSCLASFIATVSPAAGGIFWFLAIMVGYSRVYNGVHFPSDVVCGFIFGSIIGISFARIALRLLKKQKDST